MKPWLFVGAKVVCVDASLHRGARSLAPALSEGTTYTVAEVGIGEESGLLMLALEEIPSIPLPSRPDQDNMPWRYRADRFRPLHDTSKTIEEMRSLMLDATVRGKVSA